MIKRSFYDEISRNKRNSVLLVAGVFLFIVFFGWLIGQIFDPSYTSAIIITAVFIAVIFSWAGYYYSDSIVLSTVNARKADPVKHKRLYDLVEGLCIATNLPMPRLYIIRSDDINAFATGRDPHHALIAVTEGALKHLDRDELEGVLAHELSHIRNYDIRFMTLLATLVGFVVIISELLRRSFWYGSKRDKKEGSVIILIAGLLIAIIAPFLVKLIQLAVSRKREFLADASAAEITRNPDGLADALEAIKNYNGRKLKISKGIQHLFISNPFGKSSLFSTHPPIEERIRRLRSM